MCPVCVRCPIPIAAPHLPLSLWKFASQGGRHYEFKNVRSWPFTIKLHCDVHPGGFDQDAAGQDAEGTIDYAVCLQIAYRSKDHVYQPCLNPGTHYREQCVRVSVGEINIGTGKFYEWPMVRPTSGKELSCVMLGDKDLRDKLFYTSNWPMTVASEMGDEDLDPMSPFREPRGKLRYNFAVVEDRIAYSYTPKGSDREEFVYLGNFYIVKCLNIYQFVDGSHMPYHKLLCRRLLNPEGEGTVYLRIEEECRTPDLQGCKYLDVEVMIDLSKVTRQSDVCMLFQTFHSHLLAANFTPDHLGAFMISYEAPNPDSVITRFGLQPSGFFVAGNCAWKDGCLYTHEEAGVAIVPQFFEEQIMPLPRSDYPRHIIIPYPWVRYTIGLNAWTYLIPKFFGNNTVPAKATFAMAVMGLHVDKIWGGQTGFGHGCPFTWVYSLEPNTGKTEACLLAHGMLGMYHRAVWAGDVTKPALFERFSQQAGLSVVVDDVVINPNSPDSKTYSQLGRAVFDCTSRAVSGKIRKPYSSAIFTANSTINDEDKAFQSRQILIKFSALDANDEDPNLYSNWLLIRELMSALTVDFTSLLWHGKLDRHAIQDCAAYLQNAVGRKRDRNVNMWGLLLYYLLNLNLMFQCGTEEQEEIFEWMVHSVTRATFEQTNHAGILDQFVLQVSKLRADCGTSGTSSPLGPLEKTIYWDKLRTTAVPGVRNGVEYIALRVEPCISVIKNVTGKHFTATQIMHAVRDCGWATGGDASFYDTGSHPWPIQRMSDYSMDTQQSCPVPIPEADLVPRTLKTFRCVFFKLENWNAIVNSADRGGRVDGDYKSIMITSSNPDVGSYNLFERACGIGSEPWFGYRALTECSFQMYCGACNALNVGSDLTDLEIDEESEAANRAAGFGPVADMYHPASLLEHFGYSRPDPYSLPPCFTSCPFTSRDDVNDVPSSKCGPTFDEEDRQDREQQVYQSRGTVRPREDDEQTNDASDPPRTGGNRGSNPLGDVSNGRGKTLSGSPSDRPVKRRRGSHARRIVMDDATGEEEADDAQVSMSELAELAFDGYPSEDGEIREEGEILSGDEAAEREFFENEVEDQLYPTSACTNVVSVTDDGVDVLCGEPCNPSEQICHYCRVNFHRIHL